MSLSDITDLSSYSNVPTSLLIAWQLKERRVLIVGGGDVASGRLTSVLAAGAYVTLIAPADGLHPVTRELVNTSKRIVYYDRHFAGPDDLLDVSMVLTAIDDVERSREIADLCRAAHIPINAADIPPLCDFYFGSQVRQGPLQIMISTNGQSPKLASLLRQRVEDAIPPNAGQAVENVGKLREKLRERAAGVGGEVSRRRMRWMSRLCSEWDLDELAMMDDEMMDRLLDEGWKRNHVPSPTTLFSVPVKIPRMITIPPVVHAGLFGFVFGILSVAIALYTRTIYV